MFTLWPHQDNGVRDIRAAFARGHRAVLYHAPTGSGKTVLFAYIAHHAAMKGTRTCILVHRRELLRQASAKLKAFGVPHGIIAPGHPRMDYNVQVASKDTLARRDGWEFDLFVIDEAHHATADTYKKLWGQTAKRLGVTATPCRLTGAPLSDVFEVLVGGPTVRELIPRYLSPFEYYGVPVKANLSGVKSSAGDFDKKELQKLMDQRAITGDAIEHYLKFMPGKPAIAFCVTVDHAKHVAEQFRASGIRAESVDGSLPDEVRDERIYALGHGGLDVLTSCELINEGVDVPVVVGAIKLRPTKSLVVHKQQDGRVLRQCDGKEKAIILDHVGNYVRHGLPDTEYEWTLTGKVKASALRPVEQIRQCPDCFFVHDPAPTCPNCGHVYKVKAVAPPKIKAGTLERITLPPDQAKKLMTTASSLSDWHVIARSLGHKPGWAWKMFHMRRAG